MRTVDYSDVLRGSAALAGFTMDDVGTPEFQLWRTFHDRRLQVAWEIHRWPDICPLEQRTFRIAFDETLATTYALGAEVLDPATQVYYQSLIANNQGNPPSVNGMENSAYWAVCRTSYTADPFDPTAIYPIGTQVQNLLDTNFYQRIANPTTADGAWIPANWGLLTVFERNIAWNQPWMANVIGEFMAAYDQDPRITTKLVKLPFVLDQDGAQFVQLRNTFNYGWIPSSTNFSYVWLYYRLQRPLMTGDLLDMTASYTAGQQVYYTSTLGTKAGNFYTATTITNAGDTPDSAPTSWNMVQIPYTFRGYLIEGGYADWLTSDGQGDKATARENMALAMLELEVDKLQRQQQQVNRFDMRIV